MEDKDKKLSFGQFLGSLRWLIVYSIRLAPVAAIFEIITLILIKLNPLINAYIFARLLDAIIKVVTAGSSQSEVMIMLGVLLAYNILNSGIYYAYQYFGMAMNAASQYKTPRVLYSHMQTLGIQTLENPEVANKVQRIREALWSLRNGFETAITFCAEIATLIAAALVVVKIMPIVVAAILLCMLPGLFSDRLHMRKDWHLYRHETENKRRADFVSESLMETRNLQEITITSGYNHLDNIYRKFADRYIEANMAIIKSWQIWGFLLGIMKEVASIFGYFTIFKNLLNKLISIGDVTFQMRALDIFVGNLSEVMSSYGSLYEQCIRINETREVFKMKPMVSDGEISMDMTGIAPNIEIKGVSFKYPNSDRFILKDFDLEIKPGEKIAIVGENGAGKTTLVKLLSRFYKVNEGGIYLDGKNINDIKIDSWYKNLGVLFQDYNTYSSLTLKENILLGNSQEELDSEKMELAANRANVNSFMGNYTNGYEQVLSEKFKGGVRPSTGQWQKIAIARFFYRNSPVVIFDEPTAAIDAVAEAEIFGQIYEFFKNKTVIIISHRFSTVRNADKIYVLDEGKIAESGNHDQLMALKGKYYKAFTIQAEGYQ